MIYFWHHRLQINLKYGRILHQPIESWKNATRDTQEGLKIKPASLFRKHLVATREK